jgi:hypothetical protein
LIIAFCVFYFVLSPTPGDDKAKTFLGMGASNLALGLTLGVAFLLIGAGAIHWAKKLMADDEIVEYRHSAGSSPEDNRESTEAFFAGVEESGFGRRPLIRNSLLGALGLLGLPAIILLRDLGPLLELRVDVLRPRLVRVDARIGDGLRRPQQRAVLVLLRSLRDARMVPFDLVAHGRFFPARTPLFPIQTATSTSAPTPTTQPHMPSARAPL